MARRVSKDNVLDAGESPAFEHNMYFLPARASLQIPLCRREHTRYLRPNSLICLDIVN